MTTSVTTLTNGVNGAGSSPQVDPSSNPGSGPNLDLPKLFVPPAAGVTNGAPVLAGVTILQLTPRSPGVTVQESPGLGLSATTQTRIFEVEEDDVPLPSSAPPEPSLPQTPTAGPSLSENGGLVMPAELAKKLGARLDKLSPEQRRAAILFSQIPVPQVEVEKQPVLDKPVIKDERLRGLFDELTKIRKRAFFTISNPGTPVEDRHETYPYKQAVLLFKNEQTQGRIRERDPKSQLKPDDPIRKWVETSWETLFKCEEDYRLVKYTKAREKIRDSLDKLIGGCCRETFEDLKPCLIQVMKELAQLLDNESGDISVVGLRQELVGYVEQMNHFMTIQKRLQPSVRQMRATEQIQNPESVGIAFDPKFDTADPETIALPNPLEKEKTFTLNVSSDEFHNQYLTLDRFYSEYTNFLYAHCCFLKNLISPMVKVIGVIKGFPGPYGFMDERPAPDQLLLRVADADKSSKENKDNKQNGEG
jgi:hypothetical protein